MGIVRGSCGAGETGPTKDSMNHTNERNAVTSGTPPGPRAAPQRTRESTVVASITQQMRRHPELGVPRPYSLVQWVEGGRRRTKSLGFCSYEEALQARHDVEMRLAEQASAPPAPEPEGGKVIQLHQVGGDDRADGGGPSPTPRRSPRVPSVTPDGPTLRDFLENSFMPVYRRDRANRTVLAAQGACKSIIRRLGFLTIGEVNYRAVDDFISVRRAEGCRARTISLALQLLAQALALAVDYGMLAEVPKMPKSPRDRRKPVPFLTVEEQRKLLRAMRPDPMVPPGRTGAKDRLSYLAVLVGLNVGLRRQEILTRRWEDIGWAEGRHGVLHVRANSEFRGKTESSIRDVPIPPELRSELEETWVSAGRPATGWIFANPRNKNLPRLSFRKALEAGCRDAHVPLVSPHGLRHSWASRMMIEGKPRRWIIEVGGWRDGQMLDRVYSHMNDAQRDQIAAGAGVGATTRAEGA